jgi:hypothetical protein
MKARTTSSISPSAENPSARLVAHVALAASRKCSAGSAGRVASGCAHRPLRRPGAADRGGHLADRDRKAGELQ